ncbi:hypothetical protein [Desulfitobacterium hafniense]|uniref:hypothetical protein n=1 Tax=Desulfitobacterium hafniense TaxID=49338 RepID=UPI0003648574|nr:hypothetical protein [Desulfitobacterium hafniense]
MNKKNAKYEITLQRDKGLGVKYNGQTLEGVVDVKTSIGAYGACDSELLITIKGVEMSMTAAPISH